VFANNANACDDGNVCTQNDTCSGGVCVSGTAVVCDDGNVCTADVCDPVGGCVASSANVDTTSFSLNRVDGRDLAVLAAAWNSCPGDARYNGAVNLDGQATLPGACIDLTDFHLFMSSYGLSCP
jgi:hypothetical protein